MREILFSLMRRGALTLLLSAALFSGCRQQPHLAERVKAAGGADALRAECLGFVAAYEASGGQQRNWLPYQTNYPPTIAALGPRAVQVGLQDGVVLVHLGFVISPHPYGLYVAPKGCPPGFVPQRPLGSRISKLTDGVFECAE